MHHLYLEHRFVEQLPDLLQDGVLYISMEYATAAHLCCCGCGEEVVTPFTPTDWSMTFDGETISLSPSIGNWNFACRSHYFIRRGRIIESTTWTDKQVETNRRQDRAAKVDYYDTLKPIIAVQPTLEPSPQVKTSKISPSFIELCFDIAKKFWSNLRHKSKS
jgi:Family of unknown function (DUF6527)